MKASTQIPAEIKKNEAIVKTSTLYDDYVKLLTQYKELIEQGVARPRESQLRSITDPLINPLPVGNATR